MNPDFPARVFSLVAAALFIFATAAAGLTIDLGKTQNSQPISLGVSSTDTNRIELPETIINAFSSSESMDVKIIGRSALVRTESPAELIILTEKRRLTLLLAPEDVPSRTLIITAGNTSPAGSGHQAEGTGDMEPLPYEKTITALVVSLASGPAPAEEISGKERKFAEFPFPGAPWGCCIASLFRLALRGEKCRFPERRAHGEHVLLGPRNRGGRH